MQERDVTIVDLLNIIKKKLVYSLAIALVFATIAFIYNKFILSPKYQSRALLLISSEGTYSNIKTRSSEVSQTMLNTYTVLIKTRPFADRVIDNLNLGLTFDKYNNMVSTTNIKGTDLLEIKVIDNSGQQAATIANEIARLLRIDIGENKATIIDQANVPTSPIWPSVAKNTILVAVIAFILANVYFIFKDEIAGYQQFENIINLPIYATIPLKNRLKLAKVKSQFPSRKTYRKYNDAIDILTTNIYASNTTRHLKSLLFAPINAQDEQLPMLVELAKSLMKMGKKVLLIDGNMRNSNLPKLLGLENALGLSDVIANNYNFEQAILPIQRYPNLGILSAGSRIDQPTRFLASDFMAHILYQASLLYDYILINVPDLLLSNDAAILATKVDGIFLVAKSGQTQKSQLEKVMHHFNMVSAKLVGGILFADDEWE